MKVEYYINLGYNNVLVSIAPFHLATYISEIIEKYPKVNFHIYPDTRKEIKYVSSIRPHILKKHFKKHWWKYRGTFLYHDCDIVLTKPLELNGKISGCDPYCYLSNTKSYIGYEYILSKGEDILDLMCEIVDIDKEVLKINPKKIIYASCNPTTQARDVREFINSNYIMGMVQPIDMFPHTHHIECVITLDRI